MATNINGIKLKKCNVNGVKCKRINVNSIKVYTAEEYLVGSEGNNAVEFSSDAADVNWYGNPLRCVGVWAFDATGWDTINIDISGSYIWYKNPDNNDYWVNSTVMFGYSTTEKTVGVEYPTADFADYIWHQKDMQRATYTIDISGVTGTIYFWIGHACAGGGITVGSQLYNLWLT